MDYKHRRRKAPQVSGQWTPTYHGDSLELQLERHEEPVPFQAPFTKRAAVSGKEREGYGAIVSPVNSGVHVNSAAGGGAAGMLNSYNASYSEQRLEARRSRSASRGVAGDEGEERGQYDSLNSPRRPKQRRGILRSRSRSKSRSKSVEKQRAKSAGKPRATTPKKGLGGLLRRKKKNAMEPQSIAANSSEPQGNVCDYCQSTVHGKTREEMFQRLEFAYCSTQCTRSHQQALNAEEDRAVKREAAIGNASEAATMAFAEGGFGSPPVTPSAALLPGEAANGRVEEDVGSGIGGQEEQPGKQFFPSTVATATASDEDHMFDHNNWFHPEPPPGEQIGNVASHSRSNSNSWSQTSKHPTPSTIRVDYGRGISDEYRDYNDELSRQLRLAARQDELENEERGYQTRRFLDEHGSPARARGKVADASPGKKTIGSTGRNRKKLQKQNETATQSTESISSSSQGGFSNPASINRGSGRGGNGGVSPLPETGPLNVSPQRSQQSTASKASWGYLDAGGGKDLLNDSWAIHSKEDLAFGALGNWPPSDEFGGVGTGSGVDGWPVGTAGEGEGKTPKTKNARSSFADGKAETQSRSKAGFDWDGPPNKQFERQVSSLSNASPMHPISEEQDFSGRDIPPPPPNPTRPKEKKKKKKSSKKKAVIERVEDVVSIVSYYDDPSLTSLATNDTLTTRSSFKGRRSPTLLPGSNRKSKKQPRSADPPGESIDDLLRNGIYGQGGSDRREEFVQHGRDPSVISVPSYHGLEPEDTPGLSPQRRMRQQPKPSPQSYPQQQQARRDAGPGPGPQVPQLRAQNHSGEEFDVDNIEFEMNRHPSGEENYDDASMGMFTGEEGEGPQVGPPRGDDDTAAGTLDTVDLVAEVKRVWRHVQRYEQKKSHKKRSKQRMVQGNAQLDVSNLTSVDEDKVIVGNGRDESPITSMMGPLVEQFGELQAQTRTPHHDGASNFSDITPSSSHHFRGRGRSRTPDGRLGKHIRSTSAHSRQHTPVRADSPAMDSDYATASRTSTERDVHFLNEGVDAFYDGGGEHKGAKAGVQAAKPQQATARNQRTRQQTLSRLQRSSPNTLRRLSQSPPKYKTAGIGRSPEEHLLSKPYDMNKVKSTGTSFTQKTEKVSNQSALTSAMAQKYLKQRGYSTPQSARGPSSDASPDLHEQYRRYRQMQAQPQQPRQQPPKQQPARAGSPLYSRAVQSAKERRMGNNHNRVS